MQTLDRYGYKLTHIHKFSNADLHGVVISLIGTRVKGTDAEIKQRNKALN